MPQLYCKEFASNTYGSFFYGNTYDVTEEVAKALLDEFPDRFDVVGGKIPTEPEKPSDETEPSTSSKRKGKTKNE